MTLKGPQNVLKWAMYRKYRDEMRVSVPKYRVLSIGVALGRPHFLPQSWSFYIVRAKSWFCIGKYDTNSTFSVHDCINALPWILSNLKVIEVDFIPFFIGRIGPRPERMLTICRKTRYGMRVPKPKYRFLSLGLALHQSHFLARSWTFATLGVFMW